MKRLLSILTAAMLLFSLCACGGTAQAPAETPAPTVGTVETEVPATPVPTLPPQPAVLALPETPEGWAESYIRFADENYDIFAALWPEGLTGVGFIDLDLDGVPEMVVFDQGASATLGVQLFDLIDGRVCCVSSVLDSAAGAFGDDYFSRIGICASYFEAFRLSYTVEGYSFWVMSANGTLESSWDELIRFGCENGVTEPESVCGRYLESDAETGLVVTRHYTARGEETDEETYQETAMIYQGGYDMGYEARGVFLWNDMSRYDTTYDGFMNMVRDAAEVYVPIG